MKSDVVDAKRVYTVAMAVTFVNLAGCASSGQSPGDFRRQGNPAATWGSGARSLELDSAPASSATSDRKRGNTPPGMDRAGGAPGSGAIVDPAGVMSR